MWRAISRATLFNQRRYLRRCRYLVWNISDLCKRYAVKMEGLGRVHDGSVQDIGTGYWLCNVVGVSEDGELVVPAYSELYSFEAEQSSENTKIIASMEEVSEVSRKGSIWILDRGGDHAVLLNHLLTAGHYFIIRQRGDRHMCYGREKLSVRHLSRWVNLCHRFDVSR